MDYKSMSENKTKDMIKEIINLLPNYNCGECGCNNCENFAYAILNHKTNISKCPILNQEKFRLNKTKLGKISSEINLCNEKIIGIIDGYEADIILEPLHGEISCRETLLPFSNTPLNIGDVIEYRPWGCPIVHYGKIIEKHASLIVIHIIGPCKRINKHTKYKCIELCMVVAFKGTFYGKNIKVGETIRFLPKHCMMQKIHSGVITNIENNKITIEGIDLKVWNPPVTSSINT